MRKLVLSIALLLNVCVVVLILVTGYVHFFMEAEIAPLTDDGVLGLFFMLAMFGLSAVVLVGLVFAVPRLAARLDEALAANGLLILFAGVVLVSTLLQNRLDMLPGVLVFLVLCLGNLGFFGIEKHYDTDRTGVSIYGDFFLRK